jgi:hydrogenase maturation factor HypE
MVLIIKYVTTSAKHNILDIKDILFKDGDENMVTIEYKAEKDQRNEYFRSSESASIKRIFHEYQKKAYEQMDTKKIEDQRNKKIDNIGANLKDILSFP